MSETFPQETVASYWKNGKTLPLEALADYPLPPQEIENDTGINVLVDLAHQCNFTTQWKMKDFLNGNGYRYVGTHACLDTVLTPGSEGRIRLVTGERDDGRKIRPFGMWKNVEYNTIITLQGNMEAQDYLPEELHAIDGFVRDGGGLIIACGVPGSRYADIDADAYAQWPVRKLAKAYGADITDRRVTHAEMPVLGLDAGDWEVLQRADDGTPVACRCRVGKGRVVLLSSLTLIIKAVHHDQAELTEAAEAERLAFFRECLAWASEGKPPVGGTACLPSTYGGGGSIYPEIQKQFGRIVLYYTRNQKQSVLDMVDREYPQIMKDLFEWLPSPVSEEPMYILMASGMGGGWAVNAFFPKENGIAAYDRVGVLQIFAHELAHTMSGPRNAREEAAANWFDGNQGEAHAGWWQGKILAKYTGKETMRDCNGQVFDKDGNFIPFDMADQNQRGGKIWHQLWYLWQRLDETYGATWYSRWRWVQYTRWQDDPERQLSVDEMVEDMSIAVGEDLFAFVKALGTTVGRERLESIAFQGETLALPVAEIEIKPTGKVLLDPIGDYTQPLGGGRRASAADSPKPTGAGN